MTSSEARSLLTWPESVTREPRFTRFRSAAIEMDASRTASIGTRTATSATPGPGSSSARQIVVRSTSALAALREPLRPADEVADLHGRLELLPAELVRDQLPGRRDAQVELCERSLIGSGVPAEAAPDHRLLGVRDVG